jgi:hypothetical protein
MPYCPNCSTEYTEGSTECDDCHVPLVAGAPPESAVRADAPALQPDDELVPIRTFSGPTGSMNAELAQNILQTQGIPCALPGEGHAEMLPGIDMVVLLVRKEDAVRAEEILEGYMDNPEEFSDEAIAKTADEDEAETDLDQEETKPDE